MKWSGKSRVAYCVKAREGEHKRTRSVWSTKCDMFLEPGLFLFLSVFWLISTQILGGLCTTGPVGTTVYCPATCASHRPVSQSSIYSLLPCMLIFKWTQFSIQFELWTRCSVFCLPQCHFWQLSYSSAHFYSSGKSYNVLDQMLEVVCWCVTLNIIEVISQ